jgi:hypothetical protein
MLPSDMFLFPAAREMRQLSITLDDTVADTLSRSSKPASILIGWPDHIAISRLRQRID